MVNNHENSYCVWDTARSHKDGPLVKHLENASGIESKVCVTGQHRQMLDQVLELFEIKPDYDLNIMKPGQTLSEITGEILKSIEPILKIIGRIWFWSMVIPQPHFLQLWLRIISVLLWAMWRLACAQVIFTPHGLRRRIEN